MAPYCVTVQCGQLFSAFLRERLTEAGLSAALKGECLLQVDDVGGQFVEEDLGLLAVNALNPASTPRINKVLAQLFSDLFICGHAHVLADQELTEIEVLRLILEESSDLTLLVPNDNELACSVRLLDLDHHLLKSESLEALFCHMFIGIKLIIEPDCHYLLNQL